jgi:hypothetical protein
MFVGKPDFLLDAIHAVPITSSASTGGRPNMTTRFCLGSAGGAIGFVRFLIERGAAYQGIGRTIVAEIVRDLSFELSTNRLHWIAL